LIQAFPSLHAYEQVILLDDPLWKKVKCPEFIPLLESFLKLPEKAEQDQENSFLDRAIVRLNELGSGKARSLVIDDLKRDASLLSWRALLSLPDAELPELEDDLARRLEDSRDLFKLAPAVARYGTAKLLPMVKARYLKSEGRSACSIQTSFLQFWIKYERREGIAALVRAANARQSTGCFRQVLSETAARVYSPGLEEAILPFLKDPDYDVAMDAAKAIARHGTRSGKMKIVEMTKGSEADPVLSAPNGKGARGKCPQATDPPTLLRQG